jgi:signal peptide peptidase SppA
MKYERIAQLISTTPWALEEMKLLAMCQVVADRMSAEGAPLVPYAAPVAPAYERIGSVAVIPVFGILMQRMNIMSAMSGGTSTEMLGAQIGATVADASVGAVVLNLDSPGGSVFGVAELAEKIRAAREQKPIVAMVNPMASSGAYWLAAQCSEISITPSGMAGSIGDIASHVDESGANEREGIKVTYVHAGPHKAEGNPHEPLSGDARAHLQAQIDEYYAQFVADVAKGRGASKATVMESYGGGRALTATAAKSAGMVDRIETLDALIDRVSKRGTKARAMRAQIRIAEHG